MRHGDKINNLGRTASHRKAMLSNMATSLIMHKSINTTVAKAKALRKYVEPLITKSKSDSQHSRRTVFSYLQDKSAVKELFSSVAEKIADRPGGYTRILKIGNRAGDNAEMAMIELIDFNEFYTPKDKKSDAKGKRSRRGAKKSTTDKTENVEAKAEAPADVVAAPVEEVKAEEVVDAVEVEEPKAEAPEADTTENTDETK